GTAELVSLTEALWLLPERGVQGLRVGRVHHDVVGARVLVRLDHLVPRLPAVRGAEDAAFGVGPIRVSEGRDEDAIWIGRLDRDVRNHARVVETDVRPGLAGVGGFVHPVALREVWPNDPGTGSDVDD